LHLLGLLGLLSVGSIALGASTQEPAPKQKDLDTTRRSAIVEKVASEVADRYLYPQDGAEMAQRLRTRHREGEYDSLSTVGELARRLTADLHSVRRDPHLAVVEFRESFRSRGGDEENLWELHLREVRYRNFGLTKVERLTGNVGYLKIDEFDHAESAAETLHAAMRFLAYTDAMIIDLRENSGGRPELLQILLSYIFGGDPVHYANYDNREKGVQRQWWTLSHVPGKRRPDVPLYLLTSRRTASGAEELAFVLRNFERATLVGATTFGAAHSMHLHNFEELGITIAIPHGASTDPKTGKDWEGTGVKPHVAVEADLALDTAYLLALERLLEEESDPQRAYQIDWARVGLVARLQPPQLSAEELEVYAGAYEGGSEIRIKEATLHIVHPRRGRSALQPAGDDLFLVEAVFYWRIQFLRNEAGEVTGFRDLWDTNQPSEVWRRTH